MSILDDAIREHLELKRAHGADEAEVKKLEDEAFGPPQRPDGPDAFAEAPTEFLTAPGTGEEQVAEGAEAEGRRIPNIADLQEGPPPPSAPDPADEAPLTPEPSIEEHPAAEHEVVPEEEPQAEPPHPDGVHTTEEREAIADQPTEMFDVQAEIEAGATEAESPSDEELLDAGMAEPRLAPVDPLSGIEVSGPAPEDEEDDFFSEQRLSDELNQALEAPVTDEHPLPPAAEEPAAEEPQAEDLPPAFPSEETEEHSAPAPAAFAETEEGTAIFDIEEEGEEDNYEEEEESAEHETAAPESSEAEPAEQASAEPDSAEPGPYEPETGSHDDVLEDTPEFLEDAPEDENLWFEQRPPKDFDFDD